MTEPIRAYASNPTTFFKKGPPPYKAILHAWADLLHNRSERPVDSSSYTFIPCVLQRKRPGFIRGP
eukprot:2018829-Pyramimonas_sp.AAC.1